MTVFFSKIKELFSDFFLELELFFGGLFSKKKSRPMPPSSPFVKKDKTISVQPMINQRFIRMNAHELLQFYDQMETLVDSGITLIDSLLILQAQNKKKSHKKLYAEMIRHINSGLSLAGTMSLFPRIFPPMQSALIEAGEKSGNLNHVLAQIVNELEAHMEFSRKIKAAMFYPVLLLVMALVMVTGMMVFVIPKVADLYKQSNAELPALTQKVIDISGFVSGNYLYIFGFLFTAVFLLWFLFSKIRFGRYLAEKLVGATPVFGEISRQKSLMLFASNLGMLMQSGVLISDAFEITEKTMGSIHYQRALNDIRHGIVLGRSVSEMMGLEDIKQQKYKKNKLFPLQVAQMIHIGELTGTIAKMLMKIRDNYRKSINFTLKNLSTMVEPIMILVVALLIGSILLAVMLPFFYIGTTIG